MKLIINNENKKLSQKRKSEIERINKMDDKMKTLIKKAKTEKKNKKKL